MAKSGDSRFLIALLADDVHLIASDKGLYICYMGTDRSIDLSNRSCWRKLRSTTSQGQLLAQSLDYLLQEEFIRPDNQGLHLDYVNLKHLAEAGVDFIENLVPWAPFSIHIRGSGVIGSNGFRLSYEFMLGKLHSFPLRFGPFLIRGDRAYRLSPTNFEIVEIVDSFNSLGENGKDKEASLRCISRIKELTGGEGLDSYLDREGIVIPQKVKVELALESNGFVSLFPGFEGVSSERMRQEFFRLGEVQRIYDLPTDDGHRVRVLISEEISAILSDMQKYRMVGGATRDAVLANVIECFSDGVNRDLIELVDFAPRVKGICSVPERSQLLLNAESRCWEGVSEEDVGLAAAAEKPLILKVLSDENVEIPMSFKEFRSFARQVAEAQAQDSAQVRFGSSNVLINDALVEQIKEIEKRLDRRKTGGIDIKQEAKDCQVLDIHQNFDQTSYSEGSLDSIESLWNKPQIPKSLRTTRINKRGETESFQLKSHQYEGVLWLQNLFRNRLRRRGCLLADDMGLGKTLQVLTFLAWCIESGYKKGLGEDIPPYEPILIVAPIILLKNWKTEMEGFFDHDVFSPSVTLYGSTLKQYSLDSKRMGRETKDGKQKLDLDRIRENRVVITNYDTVKNYQHSLAKVPWSIIVTDEAQEFKIQNQKSDALKALKAHFRIVATGTPVENRLLDLWNLVDFMHPGSLLGSAKGFYERFEKDVADKSIEEKKVLTRELRDALYYDRPDAFVMRRDKESQLKTELPSKIEHRITCAMPEPFRRMHLDIVQQFKESGSDVHHFTLIDSLKKLYLHPRLLQRPQPIDDINSLVGESPKLEALIKTLEDIRSKKEKVLIFTEYVELQTMLAEVLGGYFGLKIEIISGSSTVERARVSERRQQAIDEFEAKEGFNILILSPKVAGVGLTIVGANHVIHYQRWWNPAKEAQATDRAYRIGQKKDVHVYYFMITDPSGEVISFDQTLDTLLLEKRELAKDFLIPRESVEISTSEVADKVQGENAAESSIREGKSLAIVKTLGDVDRLSPHQFEALIALIYRRKGLLTVLGPLTNDGGADLLIVGLSDLVYVQCKHSSCLTQQTARAVRDLEEAPDVYRRDVLSTNLRRRMPQRVAWTNATFDQETRAMAARHGIELREGKHLEAELKAAEIHLGAILEMEAERFGSLKDIQAALKHI